MQATFTQINIPERTVKVGEVFDLDTPLSIPMAGMQLDMTITTTYKLVSLKNNVADFDISQVYTMKSNTTKFPMNATGTGKGKLLYDVIHNFNLKYQIDMEMSANIKIEKMELDITSKSEINQTARISKAWHSINFKIKLTKFKTSQQIPTIKKPPLNHFKGGFVFT